MNEQQRKAMATIFAMVLSGVLKIPYVRLAQLIALVLGVVELKSLKVGAVKEGLVYPELPALPEIEKKSLFPHRK